MSLHHEKGLYKVGYFQMMPKNQTNRLMYLPKPIGAKSEEIDDQLFTVVISLVCVYTVP